MKNTLIKKGGIATAILGFGLMLSACGGGGGGGGTTGGSTASVVPSAYQGAYTGALQPGDFVSFYVSGNTLSYTVTGSFASQYCNQSPQPQPYATCVNSNSITGTLTLTPISGLSGNNYFEATVKGNPVYVFLSGSAGIFAVPTQSATLAFVGYKNTLSNTSIYQYLRNFTSIPSHTFIYAKYDYKSGSIDIYSLTVSNNYSYTYYDYNNNTSGSGCWAPDYDNNRIIAEDMATSNCTGQTSQISSPSYNIILTPAGGITVDYTNGSGIGVGVPALSNLPAGSYTISAADIGGYAGLATESLTVYIPSTGSTGNYTTLYTVAGSQPQPYTGSLTVGKDCNGTQVSGIISATNNNHECYDIFLDQMDHYYVAVRASSGPYLISIGAIQQ